MQQQRRRLSLTRTPSTPSPVLSKTSAVLITHTWWPPFNRRMLAVVMVTSTFTAADSNLSDVAKTTVQSVRLPLLPLFPLFCLTQTFQSTPKVNSKYHCFLQTPIPASMAICNCSSIIVNNNQTITLFSVVRVNSRQLARELCQCSRSTTKCFTTAKLLIK